MAISSFQVSKQTCLNVGFFCWVVISIMGSSHHRFLFYTGTLPKANTFLGKEIVLLELYTCVSIEKFHN